jgi:hypothetical protein
VPVEHDGAAAARVADDSALTHAPAGALLGTHSRALAHSPQVLHNRAFVYRKLGEYSKAIGDYSKVRRSRRRCGQPAVAAQMWTTGPTGHSRVYD